MLAMTASLRCSSHVILCNTLVVVPNLTHTRKRLLFPVYDSNSMHTDPSSALIFSTDIVHHSRTRYCTSFSYTIIGKRPCTAFCEVPCKQLSLARCLSWTLALRFDVRSLKFGSVHFQAIKGWRRLAIPHSFEDLEAVREILARASAMRAIASWFTSSALRLRFICRFFSFRATSCAQTHLICRNGFIKFASSRSVQTTPYAAI